MKTNLSNLGFVSFSFFLFSFIFISLFLFLVHPWEFLMNSVYKYFVLHVANIFSFLFVLFQGSFLI